MPVYASKFDNDSIIHLDLNEDNIRYSHGKGLSELQITSEIEAEADLLINAVKNSKVTPLKFNDITECSPK